LKLRYYILRRLLLVIPTFLGLTLIVFILIHIEGNTNLIGSYINARAGNIAGQEAAVEKLLHLNEPLPVQYIYWLSALFHGDWGYTHTGIYNGPVSQAILVFYPNSLILALLSFILITAISIPLGVWSAVRRNSMGDQLTRVVSFVGYSVPIFWFGLLLILLFASNFVNSSLNILPISGTVSIELMAGQTWYSQGISYPTHLLLLDALIHGKFNIFENALAHLVLPVIALTYGTLAGVLRITRSSMLDTLSQDYVRTARAKGLSENSVVKVHARRNALIPVTTLLGFTIAALLGGVVLIETVFDYLGLGYWTTQAFLSNDLGGIMGATVIFGLTFMLANLVVDITYGFLDPRIRY
jgi:ABC-type dipeptide/oligopeptide/nickel transport system permease component